MIKFRGVRKDNGEVVEGDLIHGFKGILCICNLASIDNYEIHPSSLAMHIGKSDKKGVEIFGSVPLPDAKLSQGGDVVKNSHGTNYNVSYNKNGLQWECKREECGNGFVPIATFSLEIIGTQFKNEKV